MNSKKIRQKVHEEIAIQDDLSNVSVQRKLPEPPSELLTGGEHDRVYLPRLETEDLSHTIVVNSPAELSDVFTVVSEVAGGYYPGVDRVIWHEVQHANAAELLGQPRTRFLAHLAIGSQVILPDGRKVRSVAITPSVILEDVRVSRLGVGLFLGAPDDTATAIEDTKRIKILGYKDADDVIRRAKDYNARTNSNAYLIPR